MRIVFMGTPDFAVPFLSALDAQFEVVGVLSQPDRPAGRGRQLQAPAVKLAAQEMGIEVYQPESLKAPEVAEKLRSWDADLAVVVAYSILPAELLWIPRKGCVNVHTSLLPKYRGAAPVQHALLQGDAETGLSIFQLDAKMDHGPLLCQWRTPITLEDDYISVMGRLADAGPAVLVDTVQKLLEDQVQKVEQDHSLACGAPKLTKEMGLLDPKQPALTLHHQVRALNLWPVAYGFVQGKMLRILKSLPQEESPMGCPIPCETGVIWGDGKSGLWLCCAKGWLRLLEVQPEGRKAMEGGAWWRGLQERENLILTLEA
jgi:methionyl-tRNA formyltransferase